MILSREVGSHVYIFIFFPDEVHIIFTIIITSEITLLWIYYERWMVTRLGSEDLDMRIRQPGQLPFPQLISNTFTLMYLALRRNLIYFKPLKDRNCILLSVLT